MGLFLLTPGFRDFMIEKFGGMVSGIELVPRHSTDIHPGNYKIENNGTVWRKESDGSFTLLDIPDYSFVFFDKAKPTECVHFCNKDVLL